MKPIGYKKRRLPLASLIAAALVLPLSSQARGPDFPNRLLVDRSGTLLSMPEGNFAFESSRLVPVDQQLPLWKEPAPATPPKPMPLSPERQAIAQMRATQTVEEADAVSAQGLSGAARLYTLGAVAFAAEDPRASEYFQQVLALRAQYSLGRVLMNDHGTPENQSESASPPAIHPEKTQLAQAMAAFQKVIDQVKGGAADPDQLALSSLGRQARIHLWLGEIAPAAQLYAQQAAQGDADGGLSLQYVSSYLINPEHLEALKQAILALNRGDYLQTMELMYRGKENYWADVADVAERVLTVDELKGFVDKHAPAPSTPLKPVNPDEYNGQQITPEVQLRELLARRMMRAGRYQEALNYFAIPNYRQAAQEFANLLKAAQDKTADKNVRAKSYYQAAALLRSEGLDFTGYEMTPDYNIYGAGYSYLGDAFNTKDMQHKSWISAAEATRARKSLPDADNRFLHYRWQAVDLAQKAADLLPPKSQAYAAVLCNAAGWVIARDAKTGRALYQRYTKNCTRFDWATKFGYGCPAPDFSTAAN